MKSKPDADELELTPPAGPKDGRTESAETMKIPTIKQACAHMMRAYLAAKKAQAHYNQIVKDIAARSNANPAAIKKLIKHSEAGTFHEYERDLNKATVLFDLIGQVPIAENGESLTDDLEPPAGHHHAH
jgi:hypothetical protein